MCQAFAAESRAIALGEHWNTKRGFAAARRGEPKSANPHNKYGIREHDYDRIAWDHGWECWGIKLLPYALELEYERKGQYGKSQKVRERFKKTGKLPKELIKCLPDG